MKSNGTSALSQRTHVQGVAFIASKALDRWMVGRMGKLKQSMLRTHQGYTENTEL